MSAQYSRDPMNLLNIAECQKIVKNALGTPSNEDFKIMCYRITACSSDLLGFMGEYFKLVITIEDKTSAEEDRRNLCFFIKSLPISNEYHRAECEEKRYFVKETSIYSKILPNIQKYVSTKLFPECFFTRPDIMVLEDLSVTPKHLRHLTASESYSLKHYHVMLRHLARLHAGSLAWEFNEGCDIGKNFKDVLFESQLTLKNDWYTAGAKSILYLANLHPKYQTPKAQFFIHEKLFDILCKAEELTAPSKEFCNVLCHRDSWNHNIFYAFNEAGDPIDCCIVDFQLTRYSPPGLDVLFLLYMTTSRKEREDIYKHCLNFYHDALKTSLREQNLSEGLITKEEFLHSCQRAHLAILILHAVCEPLIKMPKDLAYKMRSEEKERFDYYMNTKRDELFERIFSVDKSYKDIILEPVEELVDHLLELNDFNYNLSCHEP